MADINPKKMKVADLRQELRNRGLPEDGKKNDLVTRLEAALDEEAFGTELGAEAVPPTDTSVGLDDTAPASSGQQDRRADEQTSQKKGDSNAATLAATEPIGKETPSVSDAAPTTAATTQVTSTTSATNQSMTESERILQRAKRFNLTTTGTEEQKRAIRAARFGLPLKESQNTISGKSSDNNKSKGNPPTGTELSAEEIERRKRRAERFGTEVNPSTAAALEEERKRKRAERFGQLSTGEGSQLSGEEEERRKKRAERFGMA